MKLKDIMPIQEFRNFRIIKLIFGTSSVEEYKR